MKTMPSLKSRDERTPLMDMAQHKTNRRRKSLNPRKSNTPSGWFLLETLVKSVMAVTGGVIIVCLVLRFADERLAKNRQYHYNSSGSFRPASIQVARDTSGFPSFWDYRTPQSDPIVVSYDKRAILLNGTRCFFLSGSLHPVRSTRSTWENALDEAVRNGLNMVTIYVMWGYHQPLQNMPLNWSLPGGDWELADALRMAGDRGLWVHIRPGPYTCAEYSYGGIPEWLPLTSSRMRMRRLNQPWLDAMYTYLKTTTEYLSLHKLWAYQGGNIIMAQVENELGNEDDDSAVENHLVVDKSYRSSPRNEYLLQVNGTGNTVNSIRNATVQDYADWCGSVARQLEPDVLWTMCNGLSANNTISTFNGLNGNDWLQQYGDSGRIQRDQPALWSEDEDYEGGFQLWGDTPEQPRDYFWGRTARDMANDALRWFARGGTHLNYYMWWGGYNRGRAAAAAIMNGYATDAVMCPSGDRRQPKFGHFQTLHAAIREAAPVLLNSDSALLRNRSVYVKENGTWTISRHQQMFVYPGPTSVTFVENDANITTTVNIPMINGDGNRTFDLNAHSSILLINGTLRFDSSTVTKLSKQFVRMNRELPSLLRDYLSWTEPVGAPAENPFTVKGNFPLEQTSLNVNGSVSSDYAWFETEFSLGRELQDVKLIVESTKGSSILVFLDGSFSGEAIMLEHAGGHAVARINIGNLSADTHNLSILSESLGYHNLIGRWGAPTTGQQKGITGDVILSTENTNMSLVGKKFEWKSLPGLSLERARGDDQAISRNLASGVLSTNTTHQGPSWTSFSFITPELEHSAERIFLDVRSGRGHVWLNGNDLGRYWNITRGNTTVYSQRYYHLPNDFLHQNKLPNEIILFDVFGGNLTATRLIISSVRQSTKSTMDDEVGAPSACL